ncbi:MAG: hypothetical protein IKY70_07350 [Bacteroidales bacterium]|nr:hypothetical protein [Bacteroidales bacterium]
MVESRFSYCSQAVGMQQSCFIAPSEQELQQRGGVSWLDLIKFAAYVGRLIKYASEYEDDARRGFDKGWRML